MIACISPADKYFVETHDTLKYANRWVGVRVKVRMVLVVKGERGQIVRIRVMNRAKANDDGHGEVQGWAQA